MNRSALVTGASGRIGRFVRARLVRAGFNVHGLGRRTAAAPGDVVADLLDSRELTQVVEAIRPEVIVHLAGVTPGSGPDPDYSVNVDSTRALLNTSTSSRLILASTAAVYGDARSEALTEDHSLAIGSAYAESKALAEELIRESGRDAVIFRIFNVYGPGLGESLVERLIGSNPASVVPVRTPDQFVRDYIHVTDVADAIGVAADAPLHPAGALTLNLGAGRATSNRALIEELSQLRELYYTEVDGPPSYSCADMGHTHRFLGWEPNPHILDMVMKDRA